MARLTFIFWSLNDDSVVLTQDKEDTGFISKRLIKEFSERWWSEMNEYENNGSEFQQNTEDSIL